MADLRTLVARRSTRTFTPDAVDRDTVREIVDIARQTGSARNRQPWRFVAVDDPQTRAAIARLGAYAGHVADAPMVLVLLSPAEQRLDTEFDLGRVAQSVTLAAAELGLGSCVVSLYPDENARAAADLVGCDGGWVARHAIAIGRRAPAVRLGRSAIPGGRLAVDELLTLR